MEQYVSQELITQTIAEYQKRRKLLQERIQKCYAGITDMAEEAEKENLIYAASIPGKNEPHSGPKDVMEAYERYRELFQRQREEAYILISSLSEELETMNRIMVCYNSLPLKEHQVLQIFCEESDSFKDGLLSIMTQLNITRTTAMRWRREALVRVQEMYNSDFSTEDLCKSFVGKMEDI